jgi:hypothetical protein
VAEHRIRRSCNGAGVTKPLPEKRREEYVVVRNGLLRNLSEEKIRRKANELLPQIFKGNRNALRNSTFDMVWQLACIAEANILSEAEIAHIVESCQKPGINNRASYLRGCIRKRLDVHNIDFDSIVSDFPRRPVLKNGK